MRRSPSCAGRKAEAIFIYLVQKRRDGPITVGGKGGGWLLPPLATIERRKDAPSEGWFLYLLYKYGPGEYYVSSRDAPGAHYRSVFHETIRLEDEEFLEESA